MWECVQVKAEEPAVLWPYIAPSSVTGAFGNAGHFNTNVALSIMVYGVPTGVT